MIDTFEKVRILKKEKDKTGYSGKYFLDICVSTSVWEVNEPEEMYNDYPWLPKKYIEFIKEFNGWSVSFCRFYGSKKGIAIKLLEEITLHQHLLKGAYFPFGCFADGSIFLFDKQGKVRWWDKYDYDFEEEPKLLAETFEEFVGECLLGKRYGEFSSTEGDSFFAFLQSQGWV